MALPLRDDTPTRRIPWVTIALILANVIVFLFLEPPGVQGSVGATNSQARQEQTAKVDAFDLRWGAIPCELHHLKPLASGIQCSGEQLPGRPESGKIVLLSLLTAMFIHASILHIAGNMLFLWVFGAAVEDRLGPALYLALYLVTGVIALYGHALFHWNDAVPVLGASGAIAGVMGAYLVFRPRGRVLSIVLWTVVYVPAWVLLVLFFVTQFLTPGSDAVAWQAHVAGMLAGFLFALGLARYFPDPMASGPTRSAAGAGVAPSPDRGSAPDHRRARLQEPSRQARRPDKHGLEPGAAESIAHETA